MSAMERGPCLLRVLRVSSPTAGSGHQNYDGRFLAANVKRSTSVVGQQETPTPETYRSASDWEPTGDNVMLYVGCRHEAEVERLVKLPLNVQSRGRCAASSRSVRVDCRVRRLVSTDF